MIAHTCTEATVRYAAEIGHEMTVVRDATVDYSDEMMRDALDINIPDYASAIVITRDIIESLSPVAPISSSHEVATSIGIRKGIHR